MIRIPRAGLTEFGLYQPLNPCNISNGGPCHACVKMREVEYQILQARHSHSLPNLLEQHRQLRTQMNRIHNPVILQVPPEIASAIFQFCFPSLTAPSDDELNMIIPEPGNYPQDVADRLVLGAVCSGWRRIAWSTPRLWTDLAVRLTSELSWEPEFIREWLDRSGALPLCISVYSRLPIASEPDFYDFGYSLIRVLNAYADRWQVLQLYHIPNGFFPEFGGRGPTSILHSLALDGSEESVEPTFVMPHAKPMNVSLSGIPFHMVIISWENLTCARVDDFRVEDCMELLKRTPRLQRFEVNLTLDDEEDDESFIEPVPVGQVVHEQLKELYIETYDIFPLRTFLLSVVLPALDKLTIDDDDEIAIPFKGLETFLRRSSCCLRDLTIIGTHYGSSDIVSFLEHIPSLERLELIPHPHSDHTPAELFKRLADSAISAQGDIEEEPRTFLPHLRSFIYHPDEKYSPGGQDFPWNLLPGVFGPLAELDNPRRRPLRSVEIYLDRGENPPLVIGKQGILAFLPVLKAGLDLKIQYVCDPLDLLADVRQLLEDEKDMLFG